MAAVVRRIQPKQSPETRRYKVAIEKLGLPADITEDAVDMFFHNDTSMRRNLAGVIERTGD